MSKHHSRSPRDDDRDPPKKKRLDRKARRGRRFKDPTSRKIPPTPDADEFEAFLLENGFDDASEFEAEEGEFFDSDAVTDWDPDDTEH
jgi:hypothetical protein